MSSSTIQTKVAGAAALDRWRPTPLRALDAARIPTELYFIRDHFPAPRLDPTTWSARLTGNQATLDLDLAFPGVSAAGR